MRLEIVCSLSVFLILSSIASADDSSLNNEELLTQLNSGLPTTQIYAIQEMGKLGAEGRSSAPALIELLRKEPLEDSLLSEEIVKSLEKIGTDTPTLLTLAIDGGDEILATHLCIALMGRDATQVERAANLVKPRLFGHKSEIVRNAISAITLLGSSEAEIIGRLIILSGSKDTRISYRAIGALGQLEPPKAETVNALILLTKNSSAPIRYRAIASLGQLGSAAKPALPTLESIAKNGTGPISKKAAESVIYITGVKPEAEKEMPLPISLPDSRTRAEFSSEAVVEATSLELKPDSSSGESELPEGEQIQIHKIRSLKISDSESEKVKYLSPALESSSIALKKEAISKLAELGELAPPELIPGLEKNFSEDSTLRDLAADALVKTGAKGMRSLVTLSQANNPETSIRAMQALRAFNRPLSTEALIALRDNLNSPDSRVKTQAAFALAEARSVPSEIIPILIACLVGSDVPTSVASVVALANLGSDAAKPLSAQLQNQDPIVRARAVTAFALMDPPPDGVAELIQPLLNDENEEVRKKAVHALNSIDTAAFISR